MKTTRHLLTLFLLMCSLSLWAQFGPGPGGGFGAGRPPGGGRSGERPGQMQNPNRQLLTEDTDQDKASGPKIGSVTGTITDETTGAVFHAQPFPPFIQEIINDGGLVARTKRVMAEKGR